MGGEYSVQEKELADGGYKPKDVQGVIVPYDA